MQNISKDTFGPLIAYLLPGAVTLLGLSQFSVTLRSWFATDQSDLPTIGGFLYLTVASLAVGMTTSAVRWAIIDTALAWTGVRPPRLDFAKLGANVEAFSLLIEIHYKHYLYYANMLVAAAIAYVCYRARLGGIAPIGWTDLGFVCLEVVLFAASRNTLNNYYRRCEQLLKGSRRR